MDVTSAFLNGFINEQVYVEKPPGFKDKEKLQHVYKLVNALYGLKQAPRAWYEWLSFFLAQNGFTIGVMNTMLFRKAQNGDLLSVHIYVDDIIFGANSHGMCKEFSQLMKGEFEMSMMGELKLFLGL